MNELSAVARTVLLRYQSRYDRNDDPLDPEVKRQGEEELLRLGLIEEYDVGRFQVTDKGREFRAG